MSILVTGGAGYIGSHLCAELLEAGYDVVVADNFVNGNAESLRRVEEIAHRSLSVYRCDLLDSAGLHGIFENHRIEAVIHLAGLKAVGESVEEPLSYYRNNVAGTLSLLETMRRFEVRKLVFSSSATVYGSTASPPISEGFSLGVTNPYGRTKLVVEEMLGDLHASDPRWSIALLRYFNPIGAHSSGRIGEDPCGVPSNLMPYITQVAIGQREELRIFGNDYPTLDGTGVRDYIHVVDLATGHLQALRKIVASRGIEAYNLGTGYGFSVLQLVKAFEKASGRQIPFRFVERRPGDAAASYADPSKAARELEWRATRGIDAMCLDAWRWQLGNPMGYAEMREGGQIIHENRIRHSVLAVSGVGEGSL